MLVSGSRSDGKVSAPERASLNGCKIARTSRRTAIESNHDARNAKSQNCFCCDAPAFQCSRLGLREATMTVLFPTSACTPTPTFIHGQRMAQRRVLMHLLTRSHAPPLAGAEANLDSLLAKARHACDKMRVEPEEPPFPSSPPKAKTREIS